MQQTSRHTSTSARNRATGYSDADWGVLEKRLTDTRDMLRDILHHLRKVLDNLRSAGEHYQSAGRAWRSAQTGGRPGHRTSGSAAGARKTTGAASSRAQSAQGSTTRQTTFRSAQNSQQTTGQATYASATGATGGGKPGSAASGAGARFSAKAEATGPFQSSTTFQAGQSAQSARTGQAGSAFNGKAGSSFTGSPGAGAAGARYYSTGQDRQAGSGFSWSTRGKERSASAGQSASGQATGGANYGAGRQGASSQARGSAQSGQQQARTEQESRHRTTGPGGGSSYQDYRQRTHKSPLGGGRMTLTQACALLCLTYPCTADEVKAAYRKQARRHHPDLGGDEEMMKAVNQAYEMALSWCSPLRGKAATWAA